MAWRVGHRPSLDAVRGVAVLLVLLGHFGVINQVAASIGVTLFFALSGYLITGLLLGEWAENGGVSFGAFYVRRARRLLPALALLLIATGFAATVRGELATWLPGAVPVVLYVGNWGYLAGVLPHELGHTWSLAIEEQFYLLWPAALVLLVGRGLPWLRVGLVFLIGLSVLSTLPDFPSVTLGYYGSPERAKELLAGAFVAVLSFARGRDVSPRWQIAALAALFLGASIQVDALGWLGTLTFALPATVVVAWAAAHPMVGAWRPLTGTGRISYGLYLYHYPLMGLAPAFILLPATYALALASWFLVERRAIRRRAHPDAAVPATPAAAPPSRA